MTPLDSKPETKKAAEYHSLLHEMIRSFTTLARTLNLSHAVKELGSTRQTVRRHIALLEEAKGIELFSIRDRQYHLTVEGERALPEALDILARGNSWLNGNVQHINGLSYLTTSLPSGWSFYQQQHPLSLIWEAKSPLMRETLRSWAMSGGNIESPNMAHMRSYLIVYRHTPAGWICVEFGENSYYVKWFGRTKALSSVGRSIGSMPGGEDFARMLEQSFHNVQSTQSARLDHVHTQVPRAENGPLEPINYQRLMMGGRFPDGSLALFSLVEPTTEIDIFGLDPSEIVEVPPDIILKMDPNCAKFER